MSPVGLELQYEVDIEPYFDISFRSRTALSLTLKSDLQEL